MEEFEIKFLEVDVPELETKLLGIGATKVGEYDYGMTLFDYPDMRLDKDEAWLKLRTDGTETTLSFKKRMGVRSNDGSIPDEGMQEIETIVDDYKKAQELLKSIGLIVKREMVKKRIRYQKGKAVFDIDFWPEIPAYIEVESDSIESAKTAARELGFDPEQGLICSAEQVYKKYGYDMHDYSSVTFQGMVKK
jgi:adenylate cyclase, class 2